MSTNVFLLNVQWYWEAANAFRGTWLARWLKGCLRFFFFTSWNWYCSNKMDWSFWKCDLFIFTRGSVAQVNFFNVYLQCPSCGWQFSHLFVKWLILSHFHSCLSLDTQIRWRTSPLYLRVFHLPSTRNRPGRQEVVSWPDASGCSICKEHRHTSDWLSVMSWQQTDSPLIRPVAHY